MRLGIHTHALSSLTIKSTSHTTHSIQPARFSVLTRINVRPNTVCRRYFLNCAYILVFLMPVNIQLSKISIAYSNQYTLHGFTNCCINLIDWLVLVGPDGIEPSTSPLSGVRSSHLSYGPRCFQPAQTNTGGAGRDRTGDLLSANQALSQLSYSPLFGRRRLFSETPPPFNQSRPVGYRGQGYQTLNHFQIHSHML